MTEIFEGYDDKSKNVKGYLQSHHLNYIAEDCPLDECYWHYVLFDNVLLEADESQAKFEFRRLMNFIWGEKKR